MMIGTGFVRLVESRRNERKGNKRQEDKKRFGGKMYVSPVEFGSLSQLGISCFRVPPGAPSGVSIALTYLYFQCLDGTRTK